jgi:UDP-GlcNAc:undecaprenyl-phosphate GlcNAc-1-phosphate transferase
MTYSISQYLLIGIAAFVLAGLLTWPTRKLAIRIGAMDRPNLDRKTQKEPVPYLGGVSIALTIFVISYATIAINNPTSEKFKLASYVLIPALILGVMGLIDDLKGLNALPRLVVQTIAAIFVSIILIQTETMGFAFGNQIVDVIVTILWIVGICNSINFFDNLDGGAAGTVAASTIGIFFIAFGEGQELISALAILTAGATLGFLLWNKSPAKIYMGDSGALFLGVLLAVLTIRLDPENTANWKALFIPVLLLAIPILDTCIAVFSRLKRKISPLQGGQDHLSHRLVRKGLQRKSAAIWLWALSAIFSMFAISIYLWSETIGTQLIVVASTFWLFLFAWFWKIPSEG